ncbi:MAG: DUF3313 domain-containing protein [Deltaproteobacteria bacterium]|nr:DUF3313 domain-containing protein [Deltaproteobacteria bacterium]
MKLRRLGMQCGLCLAFILSGCATHSQLTAHLPQTFLEGVDLKNKEDRLPYEHSWIKPKVDWAKYKGVYVAPVRTDLLSSDDWKLSYSAVVASADDFKKEAAILATYFHEQIIEALKNEKGAGLSKVESQAGPGILKLEIAFTGLEFSHPVTQAGSLLVPVPASGLAMSTMANPYVMFAARITDSQTGELLATAADRRYSPRRLVNFNKLTATSPNREVCALLAEEFAEAFSSDSLTKVEATRWKLIPW